MVFRVDAWHNGIKFPKGSRLEKGSVPAEIEKMWVKKEVLIKKEISSNKGVK